MVLLGKRILLIINDYGDRKNDENAASNYDVNEVNQSIKVFKSLKF